MFHVEQIFPREEEKRVAKIVAIANQKGGVGKTTTAVNLSSCVAALGKKVLIVDLDPQGNTTTGYGIPKRSVEAGTYEVLIGRATAAQAIRHTEYRTDVIGSNTRLAGASLEMIDLPGREGRLRKALAEVQKDYDFIFIDCPPSLDLLTLNGLSACDSVLIPVQCEYYALEGLSELISIDLLNRARDYIHIMTPYLILDGELETALKFAAERGVDVHLILPGKPDKQFPYALAKSHYSALLDSGVKISEWSPGFVHAKVFVVDGREAVVGTINLDYRSLYHHFEDAVWMVDAPCIRDIEQDFQHTLEQCRTVENTSASIWQKHYLLRATGMLLKVIAPLL